MTPSDCSANVNDVTTPKLPPPPRSAQNRSGWDPVDAVRTRPSAVRDAVNADDVIARVNDASGLDLQVLGGEDEARLTFLAVRRWFGWSAGRVGVFDIGGGSLEIAAGADETPDVDLLPEAPAFPLEDGRIMPACAYNLFYRGAAHPTEKGAGLLGPKLGDKNAYAKKQSSGDKVRLKVLGQ